MMESPLARNLNRLDALELPDQVFTAYHFPAERVLRSISGWRPNSELDEERAAFADA